MRFARCLQMAEQCTRTALKIKSKEKPRVLIIAGTTAVGKTDLSLELAKLLDIEIISVDSAQVFRKLDIGSAKVEKEHCEQVPHHLLDVADIGQIFNAGDFCNLAEKAIQAIVERGRVPVVVGGTGLYIKTLMEGAAGSPPSTLESRAMIDKMVEEEDGGVWEVSLSRLRSMDPVYADTLCPNNWIRLKRALEICTLSGRTVTSFKMEPGAEDRPFDFKCLFLTTARVQLFHRIDARCELIIKQGLFPEVIDLVRSSGLVLESQAGKSVGYRQALEYLKTAWGFPHQSQDDDARQEEKHVYVEQVPQDKSHETFLDFLYKYQSKSRQLAQNQVGWFKRAPSFHWVNIAPGGERLALSEVAMAVKEWFLQDTPLPQPWDGSCLQTLSEEEQKILREYFPKNHKLSVFSDPQEVNGVLKQIEKTLNS